MQPKHSSSFLPLSFQELFYAQEYLLNNFIFVQRYSFIHIKPTKKLKMLLRFIGGSFALPGLIMVSIPLFPIFQNLKPFIPSLFFLSIYNIFPLHPPHLPTTYEWRRNTPFIEPPSPSRPIFFPLHLHFSTTSPPSSTDFIPLHLHLSTPSPTE